MYNFTFGFTFDYTFNSSFTLMYNFTFSFTFDYILSKPKPNFKTTVGFDLKITLHSNTTTTESQYQEYLSCY